MSCIELFLKNPSNVLLIYLQDDMLSVYIHFGFVHASKASQSWTLTKNV
jgi:hypothetical protein